ncbi:hypothetical protein ABAC460_13120 [Asticcacaulis sp. AC460]|uniref:CaiB/BaiF CoA-transferase family protein n=1 Tax=Asticcacaulis sp. AC460 TaxID=1282360 RepID=UPI0003C3DE51|nr:CoA transferase [Asticcacaulis sp. AC460]ESQ89232.1 hypothetical protein ABAC460_13120 [Asticcacaulis sp. AC460]
MSLLNGHLVLTMGSMAWRPLARYLASLGAEVATYDAARLAEASFLIDDLGLEASRPDGDHPRLIHVSVTPYGSFGPYAGWKGGELQASAMGGSLRLTGQPDRAPVKEAGNACTFHADMVAASGALAAHYARAVHGHGQHVDVSVAEVAFSRNINGILVWHFDRRKLHRVGGALNYGRATVRCIWPLADGWCFHSLMTGRFGAPANQALSDWIDEVGLDNPLKGVDWLNYNRSTLPAETRAVWETAIAAFFATRTKAEMAEEGRRRGINACVVNEPGDVLADPHLQARSFWTGAAVREPSRFATVTDGPETPSAGTRTSQRPGPLAGVRVLDFSWALVGSLTTKTLGDLGAEVIKVESRTRPCLTRLDVQVSASQPGNFDDKPWFAHLNTSKHSLALDMKKPESREVLDPLIDWADVVVENFSPGTMAKLGLDYEKLAKRNPNLIMVSGSVFGQTGPLAAEWGVDGTGAALSGRTFLTGWPDRDPVIPGAVPYGDVIVPYVMAAMASAALARRHETGRGCHIDASMYEICVQQMRDEILAAQTGAPPQRRGNDEAGVFWQTVLPARGDDRWIAISAATQAELDRLLALAGGPLEAWTAQHDAHDLAHRLQAEGFAAAPVQDIEDLMEHDPQVAARQSLVDIEHAHLGVFGHVRTPLILSRDAFAPFRAPDIGEHNRDVALHLSGLSPARFAELEALGVFR